MKYNFEQMNDFTYRYHQWDIKGRQELIDLIYRTAEIRRDQAVKSAGSDCYRISLIECLLFTGKLELESLDKFSRWMYDGELFNRIGSYQNYGTADIYQRALRAKYISDYKYHDEDNGTEPDNREKTYNALIARMTEDDFVCARVCITNSSTYGHALMVCNDNEGRPVVIDNSVRPHEWPDNRMEEYVNSGTIKWWTGVE
jgi:hypothetical protein